MIVMQAPGLWVYHLDTVKTALALALALTKLSDDRQVLEMDPLLLIRAQNNP